MCLVALTSPPGVSLSQALRVLMLQGLLLFFSISTEVEKETGRWKGAWREQVLVHCFHFVVNGVGGGG